MLATIPPLPNTPSWCGVQLKNTGTTLHYFYSMSAAELLGTG